MSKKQQILDSAIQLFAENGIEKTSVQDITKKTNVSKGAFYLSFSSKEDLIKEIIDYFMRNMLIHIDQSVRGDLSSDEKLKNYFFSHLSFMEQHADFAKMYVQDSMNTINEGVIEKMMYYNEKIDKIILAVLEEEFEGIEVNKKYDLLISIKAFIQIYAQIILFLPHTHDIKQIAEVLNEKVRIIFLYSHKTYVTQEMLSIKFKTKLEDQLLLKPSEIIEDLLKDEHPKIIQETLELLLEEIQRVPPRSAIIIGLKHNLKDYKQAKWLLYRMENEDK